MNVRVRNRHTAHVGTLPPGAVGFVDEKHLVGKVGRWLVRVDAPVLPPAPVVVAPEPPPPAAYAAPAEDEPPPPQVGGKRKKGGDG